MTKQQLIDAITNEYQHQANVAKLLQNTNTVTLQNEYNKIEKNLQGLYFVLYDEYQIDYDDLNK